MLRRIETKEYHMKKYLIGLLIVGSAQAGIETRVAHLSPAETGEHRREVLLSGSNTVLEVDAHDQHLIHALEEAINHDTLVNIEFDEEMVAPRLDRVQRITSIEPSESLPELASFGQLDPLSGFTTTNLSDRNQAMELFSGLYTKRKFTSQCFNRAHIWAKQMYDQGVASEKILIYYTRRYRKEVNGRWWFHIAPMVTVNGEKYVMDREFTRVPVTADAWEGMFNRLKERTGYRCKPIRHISEYYDQKNQQEEYCNIQVTSMYYWEPNDMQKLEKTGLPKTQWINWEIRAAAKESFKDWREIYRLHAVRD
jgi:hypothetical protein